MNDKQKQIEEMAKVMFNSKCPTVKCCECRFNEFDVACQDNVRAEHLYNANCRIIPEGSVVLTEEQFSEFRQTIITQSQEYTKLCNEMNDKIIKARKQAVKEFAERLKKLYTQTTPVEEATGYTRIDELLEVIDALTKEMGVED